MGYCVLHRMCPNFRFASREIRSPFFSKQTNDEKKALDRERGTTHESLQLQRSLSAASVSIGCALGRSEVYCKSFWWIKWNCGSTQTRSSKLLPVELPLLHGVVELLPSLNSRRELELAHDNSCTDDEKGIAAWKNPWKLLFLAPHHPGAWSQVDPHAIPSRASDTNAISIAPPPPTHFLMGQF